MSGRIWSRAPARIVSFALRHTKLVVGGWIVVALLAGLAAASLVIETSTGSILDRDDPDWDFYSRSTDLFGGDEVIVIVIGLTDVAGRSAAADIRALTRSFEQIEGVWRVDSLSTVPLVLHNERGDLVAYPPFAAAGTDSQRDHEHAIAQACRNSLAIGFLISSDCEYAAINVVLSKGSASRYAEILADISDRIGQRDAWLSGVPVFRVETDKWTRSELSRLIPITAIVISAALFLLIGDLFLSIAPVIASGVGSLAVIGLMAATGTPLTISTVILPSILIALGCAYSMHFIVPAVSQRKAIDLTSRFEEVAGPVALSGLTTIIGFLSIGMVRIESIQQIALFGAAGVGAQLAIVLTVIPGLCLWRAAKSGSFSKASPWLERVGFNATEFALRSPWLVGVFASMFGAFAVAGIANLRIETDVILWFPEDGEIRKAYSEIRDHMSGISAMNVVVSSDGDSRVLDGEAFAAIRGLTNYMDSRVEVGRALSVATVVDEVRSEIGDTSRESESLLEQYLLFLDTSFFVTDLLTRDRRAANVVLRVNENGSRDLLGLAADAEMWWGEHGAQDFHARATGIMHEFARSQDAISTGQINGLLLAFGSVFIILFVSFRDWWITISAAAANLVPIALGFGLMGLSGMPLDAGTVVVGAIAFGIAVDDSIHATTEFARRLSHGESAISAVRQGFRSIVGPIVITTLVVLLGFGIIGTSKFLLIRNLGAVTACVLAACLAANLFVLPVFLKFYPMRSRRNSGN